jgi:flagellar assembly protein FliH
LFKIDKSAIENMDYNKSKVIKQWQPRSHDIKIEQKNVETSKVIVRDALIDAEAISREVKQSKEYLEKEKKTILELAKKEAENIKEQAYKEGYNSGLKDAEKKFIEISNKQSKKLECMIEELQELKAQLNAELEDKTLQLSIDIAEKILNMQLENDDKVFVGIVKKTIAMMDAEDKMTLKLNHREYVKYFRDGGESLQKELQCAPLLVVEDASIDEGGCLLESEKGFVDAGIGSQLSKLSESIIRAI